MYIVIKHTKYNNMLVVSATELPFTDLLFEIEMESSSISVIDEMRRYFQNMTFPLRLDELVEVLDVDITTGDHQHHMTFMSF